MKAFKCKLRKNLGALACLTFFLSISQSAFSQTAATFDIDRYSTFGEGFFETYYVEESQSLQTALDAGLVTGETELLVTNTNAGNLALIRDQMAFHHIAQGTAGGKDWMATF
jgi:hypothetical protein